MWHKIIKFRGKLVRNDSVWSSFTEELGFSWKPKVIYSNQMSPVIEKNTESTFLKPFSGLEMVTRWHLLRQNVCRSLPDYHWHAAFARWFPKCAHLLTESSDKFDVFSRKITFFEKYLSFLLFYFSKIFVFFVIFLPKKRVQKGAFFPPRHLVLVNDYADISLMIMHPHD